MDHAAAGRAVSRPGERIRKAAALPRKVTKIACRIRFEPQQEFSKESLVWFVKSVERMCWGDGWPAIGFGVTKVGPIVNYLTPVHNRYDKATVDRALDDRT
jgi:hypothetical protein